MDYKDDIRQRMYNTALAFDLEIISGDKCCQLLAWTSVYGGGHEQIVLDERLSNAVLYAQQRLNINGGEIPNLELVPIMLDYIKSVTDFDNPPNWVIKLEKEYNIKAYRSKK